MTIYKVLLHSRQRKIQCCQITLK